MENLNTNIFFSHSFIMMDAKLAEYKFLGCLDTLKIIEKD